MFDFAVSNIAWPQEKEYQAFEVLSRYSISKLEVAPARVVEDLNDFSSSDVKLYRKYCERHGFSIYSMQALLFGGPNCNLFGSNEEKSLLQSHLLRVLDMGADLGVSKLVFGSPKNRLRGELSNDLAFEAAAEFFKPLALRATESGSIICIENNPTYYGADFLTSTKEVCEFVRFANFNGLGAHFDTGGMFLSKEHYADSIELNKDLISHFHISEQDLLPLSLEHIDHKTIAKTLYNNGYDKVASLEMKRSNQPIQDLAKSVDLLYEIYR
ncbi:MULTISPECIES: sugar phosphate isomerase/epimerase [Vibrio]|uniref:sugar phosphate isomerase/epimerase family protein n=1 Tax=Vibrio TaxID=662 RepID=UPI00215CE831|nr:sugar phosphate isomerase/epimerase family protein [Vibrio sp. RM-69-4]MCR9421162.1 sugar phosphate isomerase/epimerase [Vibrio sp. RM-69-4]